MISPHNLFLVDSLGAMTTAFFLVFVLAPFEAFFGMPVGVLYLLACIALGLSAYSFSCYRFSKNRWRVFMRILVAANFGYCILTIVLMYVYFQQLMLPGLFYFVLEAIIVILLASYELRYVLKNAEDKPL